MLVKDNPFGLMYNKEGENNVTSKMDFGIYKKKWGGQKVTKVFSIVDFVKASLHIC